ncbi:hypothetical protein ABGV49_00215 [Chromobacterium vaccinii]|uniref:Type III secretion system protein SpaM n=1 Tax=Chromobacterium vaccinii TaxID=1108595 RepID=A0ABV0F5Z6_9NEIS
MSLLLKIGALLRRCRFAQSRCEQALAQLARRDGALQREIDDMGAQIEGLRQLLHAQRPAGTVLERSQLFALHRKQAVMRHRMQDLDLQIGQLREQRGQLAQQREEQAGLHRFWLRKEDKYQRWAQLRRRQERLEAIRREESELEERTKWEP